MSPPPLHCVRDWPVEAACGIAYCGWQGDDLNLTEMVNEYFAEKCFRCDALLNEPAGCRWFLNWFDETPRAEMRAALAAEVAAELQRRGVLEAAT